jgi:acetolactate synthase I/III small subunit
MILIKIKAGAADRTEILQIVEHYTGKAVDLQEDSLIVMLYGNTDKVDAALRMLSKFEIIETVRTGKVVMARGSNPT